MTDTRQLQLKPQEVVDKAIQIYDKKFKRKFEQNHPGEFVVIDIKSEHAYVDATAAEALKKAQSEEPNGVFHLLRVGSRGAFRVSYTADAPRIGSFR